MKFGCSAQGRFQRLEKDPDGDAGFFRAPSILLNPSAESTGSLSRSLRLALAVDPAKARICSDCVWFSRSPPPSFADTDESRGRRGVQDRPRAVDADSVIHYGRLSSGRAACPASSRPSGGSCPASCMLADRVCRRNTAQFCSTVSWYYTLLVASEVRYRYGTAPYTAVPVAAEDRKIDQRPIGAAVRAKTAKQSTETPPMDPAPDEGSGAEAAQQLTNVLLPMDATPTLAAHVAPHAAFVSSITERADVVFASALFHELSQRFEKLSHAALLAPPQLLKHAFRIPASSRGRQRASSPPSCLV